MMAHQYPAQPGMGHPGMTHGHPMQVHHGGHMGQPNPAMMQNMHSAMSGPQVTQGGPMATMAPNPGTPAPGGPMPNHMAMAHLGGQGPMFAGQAAQVNMAGQLQMNQANMMAARQRAMMAHNGQIPSGMMNMQNMGHLNAAQLHQMQQMKIPIQQMQQMTPHQQQMIAQQQQMAHHQRMLQQHAAAQAARHQAQQQHAAAQQMQMTRSQEPVTQPPQPVPTPAPQAPVQPVSQPQPQPTTQAQQTPQPKPQQPQPPISQPQQPNAPTPQIKQGDQDDDVQVKPEASKQQIAMDDLARAPPQGFTGQCTLQLLSLYDSLANPARPNDLAYWQEVMSKYFSEYGSLRQSFFSQRTQTDKSFQLQYPSLPRFYHTHFKNGVKKIYMQSFEHMQDSLPNGGYHVWSRKLYITYEYNDGIRVMTHGQLNVNFDESQKIEHIYMKVHGWTEYIPRSLATTPVSPEQTRQSPKLTKKNLPKNQQRPQLNLPASPVGEWGFPAAIIGFLEMAEIMTTMVPLMDYYKEHPGLGPREALNHINAENSQTQVNFARMQHNANAMAANGQGHFPNQRAGMNPPNQFQSPAFSHLGLPQAQGSPHMGGPNQTPSPAHVAQGGVQMVHQMSAQGSNMSGSQGASTNTSPNVSNKRRRASVIKDEENQTQSGDSKTKPSPRVGKRQKGAAA